MTPPNNDKDAAPYAHPIDYLYWASKPYWSVDEAAAMMLDGDLTELKSSSDPKILSVFGKAKQAVAVAQANGSLPTAIRPAVFKAWLETLGMQGAPPALAKAIDDFEDGPKGTEILRRRIKELEERNRELDRIIKVNKPGGPRERETLLIMIYAMAAEKFGHNPKALKTDAAKNIENAIYRLSGKLDNDTIKGKLNDATVVFQERFPNLNEGK